MMWGATTLGELRQAVESMIETLGADTPIGTLKTIPSDSNEVDYVDAYVAFDWVCIDPDGKVVGTEGDDYELRLGPDERNAIGVY